MKVFKGTKGVFSVTNTNESRKWINILSVKGCIARTFYGNAHPIVTKEEAEANAKLIAATPELLSTLARICKDAEIMSLGESGDFVKVNIDSINAGIRAINKAIK